MVIHVKGVYAQAWAYGCMYPWVYRVEFMQDINLHAQVDWVGTAHVQATLNSPMSVGQKLVWVTLNFGQGGIKMGPRTWVFP